ncbi:PilZ domain-containing protein [Elusimicrobiota bacterium]
MNEPKEKRNIERKCIDGHTYVFDHSKEYLASGCIYDINTAGMALLSKTQIKEGTKIICNLFRKCTDDNMVEANDISGEVIRIQKMGKFWLAGVLFTDVSSEKNTELSQLTA